jgi:hypothetical protein
VIRLLAWLKIRSLASLNNSDDPFERAIALCLLERFQQRESEAEQWWKTRVRIYSNDPANDGFTWRRAERAAMQSLRVECKLTAELVVKRGWQVQPAGAAVPGTTQSERDK